MTDSGGTSRAGSVDGAGHEMLAFELDGAVERGEIVPYFQPQVDLATGRPVGAEVLSRWIHPVQGLVVPDDFIPIAEHSGAIHRIGEFMLDAGCAYSRELADRGIPLTIAVNVSAEQLTTGDFFNRVIEDVRISDLQEGMVTLEITESQAIRDPSAVGSRLNLLRKLGLGVSVDDFGVGHSSFGQLDQLPLSELKVDRSVLRNESPAGVALMAAIVALGVERGLQVVIEGVESPADLERARAVGAHRAQGFLFGRPMAKEVFERWLLEHPAGEPGESPQNSS